jgi:Dolichyl-phosphate-mannose-protein mannosyltransferase
MSLSFKGWSYARKGCLTRPAILLVLICTLVLPVLCVYPFYSDIDVHHCIAVELNRTSDLPYRASFVANLPAIVGIHLLAISLFGKSVFAFRLLEVIWQGVIVLVMYRVSRLWLSEVPAVLGCFVYALMYVHGPAFYIGHPDCFAVLPILTGIGMLIRAFRRSEAAQGTSLLFVAGMAYGVAACFRPTFALLLIVPMIFLFDPRTAKGRKSCLLIMLGFTFTIAGCLAIYAPTLQGIQELYVAVIRYNVEVYVHSFGWHDYAKRSLVIVALIAWWSIMIWRWHRKHQRFSIAPKCSRETRFLIATVISILIGIGIMGRIAGYHLTPFFALFLPVITASLWEWGKEDRRRNVVFRLLFLGTIIFLYPWQILRSILSDRSETPPFSNAWYSDSVTLQVVSYAMHHTEPTDAVEVAAFFPSVRWRIDRPVATRFNIPQCLTLAKPGGSFTPYQREWQAEYVRSIEHVQPKYYIVQELVDRTGTYSTLDLMFSVPGLRTLLDRHYRLDTTIANYMFYERREPANFD